MYLSIALLIASAISIGAASYVTSPGVHMQIYLVTHAIITTLHIMYVCMKKSASCYVKLINAACVLMAIAFNANTLALTIKVPIYDNVDAPAVYYIILMYIALGAFVEYKFSTRIIASLYLNGFFTAFIVLIKFYFYLAGVEYMVVYYIFLHLQLVVVSTACAIISIYHVSLSSRYYSRILRVFAGAIHFALTYYIVIGVNVRDSFISVLARSLMLAICSVLIA